MNTPASQRHAHPVKTTPEIVRQRPFDRIIDEIAIDYSPEQADNRQVNSWPDHAPHVRSILHTGAAMKAASASRSEGGMVRPSLLRRHRMSSGNRAHSVFMR